MSENALEFEDLNETELAGENGELYLFQWLCTTEKWLKTAGPEDVKAKQSHVESIFIKTVTAPEKPISPGRALRDAVARCLITLYTRAESRSLFDTLAAFLKLASDFKAVDKDTCKIASLYCVGELMKHFGAQYMSHMSEIVLVTLKTLKSSSLPLLRFHALRTLSKSLTAARKAVPDSSIKDIIKQARNALSDKSLPVQRGATDVLIVMYANREDLASQADVDMIINLCVRSLDSADQLTRRSLARLAGHILSLTQVDYIAPAPQTTNKGKKNANQEGDADDVSSPSAAAVEGIKKTMLTPPEVLHQLSAHFNRPTTSRKARIGLFDLYASLLAALGPSWVETNYSIVVTHFMSDIVAVQRNSLTRYETMLVRKLVQIVMRDLIGVRMLSEQAQIMAIQELSTLYLKRWPALMPGQTSPSPQVLVIILKEVAELLRQLGNTPPPVQEALAEPLITLLSHPNHTIRVNAAWALRCFCYSTPLRLPKSLLSIIDLLQRDINILPTPTASSDVQLRAVGHAYGLAALVSIIPERPLYISYDISAKVLDIAVQLLKSSGEHAVQIAGVEVEVAWTSIAALMSLGPNFVKPHLAQLLVLWRNALPKPTSKDTAANSTRTPEEWAFLLHVRESALGAILEFLRHNTTPLVTLDVARRITSLLSNALLFVNSFSTQGILNTNDPTSLTDATKTLLRSREALLRRRVFQCFTSLGFSSIPELTQTTLLQSAMSLFAGPDGYTSSVQAAIAASSGSFTSIWQSTDGYAFGMSYIDIWGEVSEDATSISAPGRKDLLNRDTIEMSIDRLLMQPIIGGREHDPLTLCHSHTTEADYRSLEPPPSATAVIDASIELFAQLLPLQDAAATSKTISALIDFVNGQKLDKIPGRKAAVSLNVLTALVLYLRNASNPTNRQAREVLGSSQIASMLSSFLKATLIDGDAVLRSASSEAIGRLASIAGTSFLTGQVKLLVDQVVNNRDPQARSGCALAFGAIHGHVGGLAAGPLLKTTVNILMSLSTDPHPLVHFWSLHALTQVIDSASLAYAPFVSSTLGMLFKAYMLDTHEVEGGTLVNANTSGDYPTYPMMCRVTDAVINVLGPDIRESTRTRSLVLNLIHQFSSEDDEAISVEAINCIQHFLMFAPEHVEVADLVTRFRTYLASSRRPLKLASINALYQLVQKDALLMSRLGGDQLVEDLFAMLDADSSVEGVRDVISSWLQQTVIYNPSAWIDLCQRIMARTTASQQVQNAAVPAQAAIRDEEGESLNAGASGGDGSGKTGVLTSRWRTQLFALQCLHNICTIVAESGRREHLDIPFARTRGLPTSGLLVTRVSDLIKMAFTASTAHVMEIRLEGLVVLRDVVHIFSKSPDPAYEDAPLLEQYQAPITAALTPAFSGDATPDILSSAVKACAVFVGSGIVKDVSRMGRILKLLTGALEQFKGQEMVSLGESGELSPNASAMLRISVLSAWAQLKVSSIEASYLVDVVKPHQATLASSWIAALRDFAHIQADSEVFHDSSSTLDTSYSSLGKEVLLPYYTESWSIILQAVATAMQLNEEDILLAMNGQEKQDKSMAVASKGAREEPTVFFYILFGLAFEALSGSTSSSASGNIQQNDVVASLSLLKSLVRPEYAGNALVGTTVFEEFMSLCYRIVMTESASILIHLLQVITALAIIEGKKSSASDGTNDLSTNSARAHSLRICSHVVKRVTSKSRELAPQGTSNEKAKMVLVAFETVMAVAITLQTDVREDVRAVAVLLYADLLQDESASLDAALTLPALRTLLTLPMLDTASAQKRYGRLIHGLLSACLVNIDEMQGRQGPGSFSKIKHNLLAAVLILTIVPPSVPIGQALVDHFCFVMSQKLMQADDISLTCCHCIRTIFAAASNGRPVLHQCVKLLLPTSIQYIAKVAPSLLMTTDTSTSTSLSPTELEQITASIQELLKAYVAFFGNVPAEHSARVLGILLPTIVLLLQSTPAPSSSNTPSSASASAAASTVHTQSVVHLLSLATQAPAAFKEATATLDTKTRDILEQSIRQHVQSRAPSAAVVAAGQQAAAKPQISLRSF